MRGVYAWLLGSTSALLRGRTAAPFANVCTTGGLGTEVCRVGDVSVLKCGRLRKMRFGSENGVETTVQCKAEVDCDGCGSCPCEFDPEPLLSATYMQTMFGELLSLCNSDTPTRVLSIGLGGGEMPQYLLHHCPHMTVEAVELNQDVITVAEQYFGLNDARQRFPDRISVQQADGLSAVKQRGANQYSAVLVDCFSGSGVVPETCRNHEFADAVKRLLLPSGMLLQNLWHFSKGHPQVAVEFKETLHLYQDTFDQVDDLAVPMPPMIPKWVDIVKATRAKSSKPQPETRVRSALTSYDQDLQHLLEEP